MTDRLPATAGRATTRPGTWRQMPSAERPPAIGWSASRRDWSHSRSGHRGVKRSVVNVTSSSEPTRRHDIATDLVEYLVLVIPGPHALASVGPELERIAESSAIRLLDVVVVDGRRRRHAATARGRLRAQPRRNPAGGHLLRRAAQSARRRARVARLATRSLRGGAGRRGPMGRTTRRCRPRRRRGDTRRRTDLATPGRGRVARRAAERPEPDW